MKSILCKLALSVTMLTISGCCDWFCGSKNNQQTEQQAEDEKTVAENEAALDVTTAVAAAEGADLVEAEETVATADVSASMPMNEVSLAEKAA